MKYRYTSIWDPSNPTAPHRRRPTIEIVLIGPEGSTTIAYAIIDSGADQCLFNIQYAEAIGLNLSRIKKVDFIGISGEVPVRIAEVYLKVKEMEEKIRVEAGFIDSPFVDVLLGQEGFFDNYLIKFEKDNNMFELTPVRKK